MTTKYVMIDCSSGRPTVGEVLAETAASYRVRLLGESQSKLFRKSRATPIPEKEAFGQFRMDDEEWRQCWEELENCVLDIMDFMSPLPVTDEGYVDGDSPEDTDMIIELIIEEVSVISAYAKRIRDAWTAKSHDVDVRADDEAA